MLPRPLVSLFVLFVAAAGVVLRVPAQCTTLWVPGSGLPSPGGPVYATKMWDPDGPGPLPAVLVVGGQFMLPGLVQDIAALDLATGTWAPIGSWTYGSIAAMAVRPNGDLVAAGGTFSATTGWSVTVARWNGLSWSPLGGTFAGQVLALTMTPNGDVFAGGDFLGIGGTAFNSIARWDGAAWSGLGTGMNSLVDELLTLPNGDVLAGGWFGTAGGVAAPAVARWDGSTWSALGSGPGCLVLALATQANGDVIAAGYGCRVMRWNGASWTPLGTSVLASFVEALHVLPNGDILAGGGLFSVGGVSVTNIARWNGTAWSALPSSVNGWQVRSFTTLPSGDLAVGGLFSMAGGLPSPGLARLSTTCPATVTPLGAGCPSSGGSNTVTAILPWAGGTWTANATGLPTTAFVLVVNGFTPTAVPLATLLPQGQPGCTLLVQPDYVGLLLSSNGTATAQFAVPNTAALAGTVFHHQMIALEYGASLAITSATATNALTMTVGVF